MLEDMDLFKKKDLKDTTLTLRVSKRQKAKIYQLAGREGISAFILMLVAQEFERRVNEGLIDIFNDGMPW